MACGDGGEWAHCPEFSGRNGDVYPLPVPPVLFEPKARSRRCCQRQKRRVAVRHGLRESVRVLNSLWGGETDEHALNQ
eukprot:6472068-Amphidinium_carterae.1